MQSLAQYPEWLYLLILTHLPNVALTGLMVLAGMIASKIIKKHTQKLLLKTKLDKAIVLIFSQIGHVLLLVLIFLMALNTLGISTTPITGALVGILIGIGMSLRSSFNTIASGIMLIATRPFKPGEFVDIGGTSGTAESISFIFCTLQTSDGKMVKIPNSMVTSKVITNFTSNPFHRNDIMINITSDSDLLRTKSLLQKLINNEARVLTTIEKQPIVRVNKLTDNTVEILIRYWTKRSDALEIKWRLNEEIKLALDAQKKSIHQ